VRGALIPTLHPHAVGWFSHENPFEFDIHSYRPAPDARRFWGGTPSVAPYAAATASLRLLQSIGISTVVAHNRSLTTMLRQHLPSCWQDVMPQHATGGTLCLPLGADLAGVQARLSAAGIRFDTRGSTLRMSCHLWNTAAEVELVANAWPQRPYSTISPAGKAAP
jgi:selenocysteine lyase/cysteine desulfurase